MGLDQLWRRSATFAAHIETLKAELIGLLRKLKADGKRIAGFGAPAKTTTLMYHFGFEPGMIDFIVDDSPLKAGPLHARHAHTGRAHRSNSTSAGPTYADHPRLELRRADHG